MADIIDDANNRAQMDLDRAIAAARQRAELQAARPLPTECDNGCGSKPTERGRYCSSACREDHEIRIARAKRLGMR